MADEILLVGAGKDDSSDVVFLEPRHHRIEFVQSRGRHHLQGRIVENDCRNLIANRKREMGHVLF